MSRQQFWGAVGFAAGILLLTAVLVRVRCDMAFTQKVPFDLWTGKSYYNAMPELFTDTLDWVVSAVAVVLGIVWLGNVVSRVRKRQHANQGKDKPENGK